MSYRILFATLAALSSAHAAYLEKLDQDSYNHSPQAGEGMVPQEYLNSRYVLSTVYFRAGIFVFKYSLELTNKYS